MIKKMKESTVLIECNFIVEVGQSAAAKGDHPKYVERIITSILTQNKQIREVLDVDAFEPDADMGKN